jgi:hypothetical protein
MLTTITDPITGVSIPISVFEELKAKILANPKVISVKLDPNYNHNIFDEFAPIVHVKEHRFNRTHKQLKELESQINLYFGVAIYLVVDCVATPFDEYLRLVQSGE